MYKRKTKSGNLGIVRTVSRTQQIVSDTSSKGSVSSLSNKETKKNDSPPKSPTIIDDPDPDEVLSDSEPSPKKSRRFLSDSSSIMKELSTNNLLQTKNKANTPTKLKTTQTRNESPKSVRSRPTTQKSTNISKIKATPEKKGYAKISKINNNGSYMGELFEKFGFILSDGSSSNILQTDQAIFTRDVNVAISYDANDLQRNVENIMKDLEKYCIDYKCFKFSISSTETASDSDVPRGATQDSLMRLLLHIDPLQGPVTEFLMEKLGQIVMDGTRDDGETPVISWVRMILQCFRFLDRMINGSSINERLLDIIMATSDTMVQQEVIMSLPDIISDAEHHHTALELSKLIRKSNPQLLASALEALTNLSIQPEMRAQIQPLLMKALHKVPPEYLPTILKFLFTECSVAAMDEIISYLRCQLDLTETNGDTASIQVLVFSTLRDALLASRTLPTVWQKNISSVKAQVDHKPLDILMLIVILSTTNDPTRQRSIETVFRNRIRLDMFTEALINETLKSYIAVIKEYFHITTKLAGALLKSTEPAVMEFGSKMYIGMFVNMEGLWCKWVLSDLQVCVGAGDTNAARAALNVVQYLTNNHHDKVKPLGVTLMLLLNKLNDLALSEVCQLMDILCHIAYSDDNTSLSDCSILQDEISILVQKQLGSSQLSTIRNGVISCVMTIKHTAKVPESTSEPFLPDDTTEKAKKSTQLLELLLTSTRGNVEVHGLALDQLAHLLISTSYLDQTFVQKLSSLMRDTLQDAFLIAASDFEPKDDVLKSSLQFFIDEADTEGAIALNLSELVATEMNSNHKRMMGVSCLHPLLRLLRGLEMSDLSEIDALLGCAIAMPVPAVYSEFSQLSPFEQHVALHCVFHCINWLIEIINCFAYLVKKNEAEKVLMRLRTVVWFRNLLSRVLPMAMAYTPPICHFQPIPKPKLNATEKTAKKGNKKKGRKGKKKQNEEGVLSGKENTSNAGDEEEEEEEVAVEKMADLGKYKHYFRELDIDVWLILTQPLTLSPTPEKNGVFTPELGPNELLFLLDDYVTKLSRALTSSNKRLSFLKTAATQNVGFENLDKFTPLHIAKNTIKLLPHLCTFLEKTMEYTRNLVKVNDAIFDATGMFMDGSAEIKKCQGKILKVLTITFSWVGFQNQVNINLLMGGLQKLASRVSSDQVKNKSKKLLVRECIQYLSQCHEHVLDLTSACTLVDAMKALVHHADDDPNLKTSIASMCHEFLKRRWYDMNGNREKGAALNSQVGELLSCYFSHSEDQLATVTSVVDWFATESLQLAEKDATLSTFPSFSKLNLHLLIGGLLKGLEGGVKQKLEEQMDAKEQLELWSSFTQCLEALVNIMKTHDSKANLRVFMKGCTTVLRLFLSQGMTTCTNMFKHESNTVSQILKKLQVTTRYIQTICNFIKVSKDTTLTQFLPPIRAVMETILLRVKSIIVLNNCADAFFMGSMKNRDLKGQEIPSQEIEDEEESMPNDADSDTGNEEEEKDDNETDDEENEEMGESISI